MRLGTIAFLAGTVLLVRVAELPDARWCYFAPLLIVALVPWRRLRPLLWLAVGFLWALWRAHLVLSAALPPDLEGKDVLVSGTISSLPEIRNRSLRFEMVPDQLLYKAESRAFPGKIRLSWYGHFPNLQVGDKWRLSVRLKRPHGFSNPGGFDYEAWLFRRQIRATGYVREHPENRLITSNLASFRLQRLRQKIADSITDNKESIPKPGLIMALALGNRQLVNQSDWQTLTRTGTSHLLAISGLHIGIVAGLFFWIGSFVWRRTGLLVSLWPAQKAGAVSAMTGAIMYAGLAGFSVPTQRALIMVLVMMVMLIWQRPRAPSVSIMAALLAVLIFDPLSVLASGFWLSFVAVATILYLLSGRLGPRKSWPEFARLHLFIAIGLAPLLALFFQQIPLVSPLTNMLAIPLVTVAIVPLVLFGTALLLPAPYVGVLILKCAGYLTAALFSVLAKVASLAFSQWIVTEPSMLILTMSVIGCLWCLAPHGWPGRWVGLICLMPLLISHVPHPGRGEFQFTLLDVGQGLAAVVQTSDHVLVYDTGPRFSNSFDAGRAVVVPYLHSLGLASINRLVLSHANMDHAGGLESIMSTIGVDHLMVPNPAHWPALPAYPCHEGQIWYWDGIKFEILNGKAGAINTINNNSCVLRVSNKLHSVLLTGDIEKGTEARLVRAYGRQLAADILVAPHHGSNTSSTAAFVKVVKPNFVLFSVGYRNRFGFPTKAVQQRYTRESVEQMSTAKSGAITFQIKLSPLIELPREYRHTYSRYWHFRRLVDKGVGRTGI